MNSGKSGLGPQSPRNPLIIFLGFVLIGAALAILLFGQDLFGRSDEPAVIIGDATTVLDQVSELPEISPDGSATPSNNRPPGSVFEGDPAPDFTLLDLDGNAVSLSDFRGQPVVVNFWATWCAPCRIEMPALQDAYEKYQDQGLVILALNQDEPADLARGFFFDEMGLTFTPLLDEKSAVSATYGSFSVLPSTYFVDSQGNITAVHRGPLTLGQIEGYLAGLLPESS
jgi:cytochrome c biogenesis protein CcmG/thiol:disulfide interchange protein DsbE